MDTEVQLMMRQGAPASEEEVAFTAADTGIR